MGKACVHFKRADDLALDVVGELVASTPLDRWVEIARAARRRQGHWPPARSSTAGSIACADGITRPVLGGVVQPARPGECRRFASREGRE